MSKVIKLKLKKLKLSKSQQGTIQALRESVDFAHSQSEILSVSVFITFVDSEGVMSSYHNSLIQKGVPSLLVVGQLEAIKHSIMEGRG